MPNVLNLPPLTICTNRYSYILSFWLLKVKLKIHTLEHFNRYIAEKDSMESSAMGGIQPQQLLWVFPHLPPFRALPNNIQFLPITKPSRNLKHSRVILETLTRILKRNLHSEPYPKFSILNPSWRCFVPSNRQESKPSASAVHSNFVALSPAPANSAYAWLLDALKRDSKTFELGDKYSVSLVCSLYRNHLSFCV